MNHFPHYRLRLASFVLLAAALFAPIKAHALTISPARLEIAGDAGTTITKKVLLVNETEQTETYFTSYSNFDAQGDTGTPIFVDATNDLGTWMNTDSSFTLKPGSSKEVTLSIRIPEGAEPGGHFAAVFWGTTPPSQGGTVSVGSRTGLLVLLSVSGPVEESVGLVDFHTKGKQFFYKMLPVGFEYRFSNQGGDRIKPVASITIRSILGWRVAKIDANPSEGNVLPTTTRKFTPEWKKRDTVEAHLAKADEKYSFTKAVGDEWHNFAVGIFRAKLKTEFGTAEQRMTSRAAYFIVFPWELMIILIPGAYIVFLLLRLSLRRYNRSVIKRAQRSTS